MPQFLEYALDMNNLISRINEIGQILIGEAKPLAKPSIPSIRRYGHDTPPVTPIL